jgi:hypothetical protein
MFRKAMCRKYLGIWGAVWGLVAVFATVAIAQELTSNPAATVTCQTFNVSFPVANLGFNIGSPFTIDYRFTATCNGTTTSFPGFVTFTATSESETVTAQGTWSLTGGCTVTGTASLYATACGVNCPGSDIYHTYPITFNGSTTATLNCPSFVCTIPPSGTAISGSPVSWNGFTAPAGSVVWINAHLDASNVPKNTITTVDFTGVTLVVNSTTYALPNGAVVFNPAASTPTTVVNSDGSWTTTVNPTTSGDIFFDGQAIPVDSNLENGGHGNTGSTLSFSTNSTDNALDFQWQWGAAVYMTWPGNAAAAIEPVPANGLQSGAPKNTAVQKDLIQGPRGGGGSNFTGSWSGTGKGACPAGT